MSYSSDEDIEDILDEGFDFVDDDAEDIDDDRGSINTDYIAYPFYSMYASEIPDNRNPEKILNQKEIILYNPFDNIEPYKTIDPVGLSSKILSEYFIVDKKSGFIHSTNFTESKELARTIKLSKEMISQYDELNGEQRNENNKEQENKNKNNYSSMMTPKNPNSSPKKY